MGTGGIFRIIFSIGVGIGLILMLINGTNEGHSERKIISHESYIETNIEKLEYEEKELSHHKGLLTIISVCDESKLPGIDKGVYTSEVESHIAKSNVNIEESIASNKLSENIIKKEEKDIISNKKWFGYAWKEAALFAVLFLLTFIKYDYIFISFFNWIGRMISGFFGFFFGGIKERMIYKPSEFYIQPLANRKFRVIFKRWWWSVDSKQEFDLREHAIAYIEALKKERFEKNWDKI